MITLHGEEIRLGDEVWDVLYGWGEVTGLKDSMKNVYPIGVQFEGASRWYTEDGKLHAHKENPTLFWQPIEFELPKKPKQREKVWQGLFFDSQRAAFEAFLASQMPAFPPKVLFERRENGEYVSLVAHYSWKAWQAALASTKGAD